MLKKFRKHFSAQLVAKKIYAKTIKDATDKNVKIKKMTISTIRYSVRKERLSYIAYRNVEFYNLLECNLAIGIIVFVI